MSYTPRFYDLIREGAARSASVIVPEVVAMLEPRSVVDVGCGEGVWLEEFGRAGVAELVGIDGAHVDRRPDQFLELDLGASLTLPDRFDLAVSLEVAEHLLPERAFSFVTDLCALSDRVLFSAAIPGQGGAHHVNEQWPDYWADLFEAAGYQVSGALRWRWWTDERVEPWYRQNLLLAARPPLPDAAADLFKGLSARPLPVVLPLYWRERVLDAR